MKKVLITITTATLILVTAAIIGAVTHKYTIGGTCRFFGGWGRGTPAACRCIGKEVEVEDDIAIDGDYKSICIGVGIYQKMSK